MLKKTSKNQLSTGIFILLLVILTFIIIIIAYIPVGTTEMDDDIKPGEQITRDFNVKTISDAISTETSINAKCSQGRCNYFLLKEGDYKDYMEKNWTEKELKNESLAYKLDSKSFTFEDKLEEKQFKLFRRNYCGKQRDSGNDGESDL